MVCRSAKVDETVQGFDTEVSQYARWKTANGFQSALTLRNAQIGRPGIICLIPAAVHMIQARLVLEVRPVNRKLIVCVQLGLNAEICRP